MALRGVPVLKVIFIYIFTITATISFINSAESSHDFDYTVIASRTNIGSNSVLSGPYEGYQPHGGWGLNNHGQVPFYRAWQDSSGFNYQLVVGDGTTCVVSRGESNVGDALVMADPKPGTTPGLPIIPEEEDEIPSGGWNIRPEGYSPNCWWHSNSKPGSNRRGFTDSPKKPNWFSGFFIAEFCHLNAPSK